MPRPAVVVKLHLVDLYRIFSVKLCVKLVFFPVLFIRQSSIVRLCLASLFRQLTKLPQRFFCNSLADRKEGQFRDR